MRAGAASAVHLTAALCGGEASTRPVVGTLGVMLANGVQMRVSLSSIEEITRLVQDLSRLGR